MVEYLSLILSEGHIEIDPVKMASACIWLILRNMTAVQSFVLFVNFYWQFIQDLLHMAKPLHLLTKKGEAWRWTEDKQKAFEELKKLITLAPIPVQPDQDAQFQLETDASGYATGTVLSCEDDKWCPIRFTSRSLSPAERNYEIHDNELLSVM